MARLPHRTFLQQLVKMEIYLSLKRQLRLPSCLFGRPPLSLTQMGLFPTQARLIWPTPQILQLLRQLFFKATHWDSHGMGRTSVMLMEVLLMLFCMGRGSGKMHKGQ